MQALIALHHSVLEEIPPASTFTKVPKRPLRKKKDAEELINTHLERMNMHHTLGEIVVVFTGQQEPPEPPQRRSPKIYSTHPSAAPNEDLLCFLIA